MITSDGTSSAAVVTSDGSVQGGGGGSSANTYMLCFGATANTTGEFMQVNGTITLSDYSSGSGTRHNIVRSGTVTAIAWTTELADDDTVFTLHKNGVEQFTFSPENPGDNDGALTTLPSAVSVIAGTDYIEIGFKSGTSPSWSTMHVEITT